MTSPPSPLWTVQQIEDAGRGAVATQRIAEGAVVHASGPPAVHVVFQHYGKETCAHCFLWDRGRRLAVREASVSVGKVFCSAACQSQWTDEHGTLGVEGWRALATFTRSQGKAKAKAQGGNGNGMVVDETAVGDGATRPSREAIGRAWRTAAEEAEVLRNGRSHAVGSKQERRTMRAIQHQLSLRAPDADLLSYFLCAVLHDSSSSALSASTPTSSATATSTSPSAASTPTSEWRQQLLELALDETPYTGQHELDSHCRAFLQLTSILPPALLPHLTPELCRTLVRADNHNAFGIRAGGEDAEEYMGYGVWPDASYFNHSCAANLHKKRVGRHWEFRAARTILPGEECCITYLGGDEEDLGLAGRRDRLESVWGFVCQCARCTTAAAKGGR